MSFLSGRLLSRARPANAVALISRRALWSTAQADLFSAWKTSLLDSPPIISKDLVTSERIDLLRTTLPTRSDQLAGRDSLLPGDHLILFPPYAPEPDLSPDGSTSDPLPSPPPSVLNARMWVGGSFSFTREAQLRAGEVAQEEMGVSSVELKKAGELCFVETRREIKGGDGRQVLEERRSHVYKLKEDRATSQVEHVLPPLPVLKPPLPAGPPDFSISVRPTGVTLFRFSALTFNAHRIHYDVDYCRNVEQLPGPLIHGPLTALLLLDLVRLHLPSSTHRVVKFTYRATSPLVVDQTLQLCGKWNDEDQTRCVVWAVGHGGRVGMRAEAELQP